MTTPLVYYNEWDSFAAGWLRELMQSSLISPGAVDERSIADVSAQEIQHYTRCHFFAGIGGWEEALRLAGWPATRSIWTASCPCQPFSVAGKQKGEEDERHLWPVLAALVRECKPPTIFGEQVSSKLGREWMSGVRGDLEAMGYAVAVADIPASALGAPHIRQRLFWVASLQQDCADLPEPQMHATHNQLELW